MANGIRGAVMTAELITRVRRAPGIPLVPFGLALSLFLAITYVLCIGHYLLFPGQKIGYQVLLPLFLPGFTWLSWGGFFIGLVDSLAYGWYVALIFVPLFNFFAVKFER